MRLFMPVFLALLTACGSGADSSENSEEPKDSTMTSQVQTETDNTLTPAEVAEGWVLLFDGSSKANWHPYLNKSDGASWKVQEGALMLDTTKTAEGTGHSGDLVSNDEYENYHLKVDWKISKNGNSGIIFNMKEDPKYKATYETGPEMQVLDNDGHADGKIKKHRAGDLYDLISSSSEPVKPVGEWNTAEVISLTDSIELILNGVSVVKTGAWDSNWKKMIAGSKFKAWKDFGTFKRGHIALQDHGNMVSYKNIKIKTF